MRASPSSGDVSTDGASEAAGDGAQVDEGDELGAGGHRRGEGIGHRVHTRQLRGQGAGALGGAFQEHDLGGPVGQGQHSAHIVVEGPGAVELGARGELEAGGAHPASVLVQGQGEGLDLLHGDVVGQDEKVTGVHEADRHHGGGGEGRGVDGQGDRQVPGGGAHLDSSEGRPASSMRRRSKLRCEREAVGPRCPW